ncbi:AsmA-like C-terminal region-containing protein [Seonamhaeicola maritimus]|uniref:AsmA family protein n=1 Tax=Seonamhaeicola maritimus TaxID=2591822 RepID=A0A5C7GJ46_9FLAO|nr:AsmA-like C-terminal region-containing protein [Seonamhaeicola maritimus]TXG38352.1 AsmA family protein [Seonamhaeicola maritimus]
MKKILKITGIILLIVIALLIAAPFAFQSQITDIVKRYINQNLNAKVEFKDVSLSFIQSFPQAHVSVSDLTITNFEPFKDETLVTAKDISFTMNINELFKTASEDPIVVKSFEIDEALVTLKSDKFGNTNYDIVKESEDIPAQDKASNSFSFSIEDYSINNSALTFLDEATNMLIHLSELNHNGSGVFSAETSELDTESEANISFTMDSINYLENNTLSLDAVIGLDLEKSIYTFKDNIGFINKLPIEFDGSIKQLENGQQIDITFENPQASFKDFLAVMPKAYTENLDNIVTTGDFKVKGLINGLSSNETIPNLDINITSNNASFKYPNLPKRVEQITINTSIKNTTGKVDDTYVNIEKLNFKIDDDVFKSSATLKNLTQNMLVNANIDGSLNLANITKVYPIEFDKTLSGILKGKINTAFDMKAIETNAFERIKTSGSASVTDFIFSSDDIVNPIHISTANMKFNPHVVLLNSFEAKTGESDFKAVGKIENLLGFLLSDNTLKGNFNVNSNLFKVSDFMTEYEAVSKENKKTDDHESLKIPAFLDCTINANANTVVYDNLNLKDVSGTLIIKDQQATFKDITSNIFDGSIAVIGNVSTKEETPTFDLNLGVAGFDIAQSFNNMALLQNLAPVTKLFQGKLNSTLHISGDLDSEFSPKLSTVSGIALAELLTTKINANKGELFNALEGQLSFIDFDKLDLKDIKTELEFADGGVNVKPFDLKYEDIAITVSGSHKFDKTLDYKAVFNVPAKYLGSEVNRLIGKINTEETNNISIPVTANIDGSYNAPNVKTDLSSAVSNLTKQLIEIEKQKLLNQGKDKVKDLLGGILGSEKSKDTNPENDPEITTPDSTNTIEDDIKNVLGGLLGKKKKKQDTIN